MATRRTVKDAAPQRRLKLGALENNLGYLSRMVRNVALQSSGDYVDELGFATGQITMLGLISANSGVSQNVLAQAMLMRKSQVTGLIQDLVARGYVTRGDHDADRRINTLRLTESGQQVWRSARARIDRHSASMLSGLEEAEQQELTRLLRKLLAARDGRRADRFRRNLSAATADRSLSLVPRAGIEPARSSRVAADFLAHYGFRRRTDTAFGVWSAPCPWRIAL